MSAAATPARALSALAPVFVPAAPVPAAPVPAAPVPARYPVGVHDAHDSISCAYCQYTTLALNQLVDHDSDTFRCVRCRCPFAMGAKPPAGRADSEDGLAAGHAALFPPRARPAGRLGYMPLATNNRSALLRAGEAHCLYCRQTFASTSVEEWADKGTAICPHCGIDAVVPSTAEDRDRPEWWVERAHWSREGFGTSP